MQFENISIPTPWKVNTNSEGVGGGSQKPNFLKESVGLGISRGVGDSNQRTFCGMGVDIFCNNTI